jgi:hypothetical protein
MRQHPRLEVDQERSPVKRGAACALRACSQHAMRALVLSSRMGGRSRDVLLVIRLVEEDVLPVATVRCEVLEDAVLRDAVLETQLLPELHADLVATLANL